MIGLNDDDDDGDIFYISGGRYTKMYRFWNNNKFKITVNIYPK